jgi:hypothetical protein
MSPKLPPSPEPGAKLEAPPPKPLKRSSSKLLGGDAYDDEDDRSFDAPSSQQGGSLPPRNFAQGQMPQNQVSSPIPKMMGGAAIFFALLKMPLLVGYLPSIANPQYTWTVVDLAATTAALIALGLAFLMSKI